MRIVLVAGRELFQPLDPRPLKQISSLRDRGHEVYVITPFRPDPDIEVQPTPHPRIGVKIYDRVPIYMVSPAGGLLPDRLIYRHLVRACNPDLVILHELDSLLLAPLLYPTPLIYDCHDDYPRLKVEMGSKLPGGIWRSIQSVLTRLMAVVVTVDLKLAARVGHHTTHLLPNYPHRTSFKCRPWTGEGIFHVVYAGGLSEKRGLPVMLAAIAQLIEAGLPVDLTLYGELRERGATNLVNLYTDSGWLHLGGWVSSSQLAQKFENAHLGLSLLRRTPRMETIFPAKVWDYVAAGMPVVVSNNDALSQFLGRNEVGQTVDPMSVDEVANAIETLVSDPGLWNDYAQVSLKVGDSLSWEAASHPWLALIDRLVPSSSSSVSD